MLKINICTLLYPVVPNIQDTHMLFHKVWLHILFTVMNAYRTNINIVA